MTVYVALICPECGTTDIVRNGKSRQGKQRYLCRNEECTRRTFILNYTHNAYKPGVKRKIPEMVVHGSGIRDTARVLNISTHTVMSELKKADATPRRLTAQGNAHQENNH